MELKQLKHFVALANNCHVSKTAYQLNISQPALSKSIIQLEKELGIKLFDRMGKKMVLSKSGERFFSYVEKSLTLLNQGVQAAREERYIVRGEIVVRELVIVTQFVQDMLLYQELNPTVRFVVQGYSAQSLDDEDTCDFLICTNLDNIRMNRKSKCWSEVQLANGQMCIAVSRESKWYTDAISKEGAAYMSDFKDALFSMVAKRNRYESDVTIKLCQEAGFYPQIYSRADDYAFRMGQVDRGLAISVVTNDHIPELERNYKNICVVPLKDAGAQFKIYLLHPQESMLSEAALDFLELLKENHEELC